MLRKYSRGASMNFRFMNTWRVVTRSVRIPLCVCALSQDKGECLDEVPYYQLECARDDTACLERKRRMGSKAVTEFFTNPTSSPAILVFSM